MGVHTQLWRHHTEMHMCVVGVCMYMGVTGEGGGLAGCAQKCTLDMILHDA